MLTIKQITDDKEAVIRGLERNTLRVHAKLLRACWPLTINASLLKQNLML